MRIKVVDTPDNLFEYTADVAPRKDEFIFHKDQAYKVSYVCHYVGDVSENGEIEEIHAVAEVAPTEFFFSQRLKTHE